MALALNYRGFDSKAAFSGEEAVAAAAEFTPDVVVSDVLMGGISGIEAAIQIRRVFPEIRIILYYAQVAPADMLEMARAHGFQLFGNTSRLKPSARCSKKVVQHEIEGPQNIAGR